MSSQFVHVAQFFESTLCFTIPLLLAAQVLAFKHELWEPIDRIAEHDYQQNEKWKENEQIYRGSLGHEPTDQSAEVPNSVERNIKQQLIIPPPPEPTEEPHNQVIVEENNPKSNPELPKEHLQQPPAPANEIAIQIINQPAPSNYPIEEKPYLKFYLEANLIFDEYVPVIMCCMVLGILVFSTYILSMFCFFSYLIVSLMFNYAKLFEKLAIKIENPLTPQIISNLAGVFLITFFIGLFIRTQFYGIV